MSKDGVSEFLRSAPYSYILKVVGGGPTAKTIREYSEAEIFRYNSPLDQ